MFLKVLFFLNDKNHIKFKVIYLKAIHNLFNLCGLDGLSLFNSGG